MPKRRLVPIHHQVYLTLRNELISGHFRTDQPMPDEPRLAEQFGVSRMTLRRALARLQQEKLIVRKPRIGTFALLQNKPYEIPNSIAEFHRALAARGDITKQIVRTARMIPTPIFLRQSTADFGSDCLRVAKLTFNKSGPMHYGVHYVPGALAAKLRPNPLARRGDLLWLQDVGIKAARTDLAVSASAADLDAARQLRVDVGTPLISSRRFAFDALNRPIEYLEALSRTDRFNYAFRYDGAAPRGARL